MLFLPGQIVHFFLALHENKLTNKVKHRVLAQNIFPHVINAVFVGIYGISGTSLHAFATAHVKGQEECPFSFQLGGHIDFLQIHGKVDYAASLEAEQAVFRITLSTVL